MNSIFFPSIFQRNAFRKNTIPCSLRVSIERKKKYFIVFILFYYQGVFHIFVKEDSLHIYGIRLYLIIPKGIDSIFIIRFLHSSLFKITSSDFSNEGTRTQMVYRED